MNIAFIDYTASMQALDIYLSGCLPPHCPGCHNPELWDFNVGYPYFEGLKHIQKNIDSGLVTNVMIMGGEPLHQNLEQLQELLMFIYSKRPVIWLFTRHQLIEVPESIKQYCDYIKTGPYRKNFSDEQPVYYGMTLASANQCIWHSSEFRG